MMMTASPFITLHKWGKKQTRAAATNTAEPVPAVAVTAHIISPRVTRKHTHRQLSMGSISNSGGGGQHGEIGHKSILQTDALYQYILETSVYPREQPCFKELREITKKHPLALMSTSPDEAMFLNMLVKLINAKNTMEVGVFTGYSLLATALGLPDDGKVLAIDPDRESYEMGLPIIQKTGVEHKIDFRESEALPVLDHLLADKKNHGTFDFIFVDADKDNYKNYHARLIDLVKIGGVIGYDNTLWKGSVAAPLDTPYADYIVHGRDYVLEFNKILALDPRVEICQLSIGDGITLCRRNG